MKIIKGIQLTPKLASTIVPIIIGIISSSLLLFVGLFPINNKVKIISKELNEYKQKSLELNLVSNNFKKAKLRLKDTYEDKFILIDIIAGNTDLKTLFAKLNSLAIESSITIQKIKPLEIVNFENKNLNNPNNESGQESSKNKDPLITPDTFKEILNLELSGDYDDLISFLQKIESLENLISIESLQVKESNQSFDNKKNELLKISFNLVSYGKIKIEK